MKSLLIIIWLCLLAKTFWPQEKLQLNIPQIKSRQSYLPKKKKTQREKLQKFPVKALLSDAYLVDWKGKSYIFRNSCEKEGKIWNFEDLKKEGKQYFLIASFEDALA